MTTRIIFATILAGSVAAVAAQDPARPDQKSDKMQTITVTGCLQSATAATPPAGDPAQARQDPASSAQFVLAQAKVASAPAAPTGTSGTAGIASADKFRLIGGKPEMKDHLNHRVEITGTLQPRSERGQDQGVGADPQKSSSEADLPALRVTGFKHVAATCGPDGL